MEKNVITKIKSLLTEYGFISETPEVEYKSFKIGESLFQAERLEVGQSFFIINEESGERELAQDTTYLFESDNIEVKEGKILSIVSNFADVKLADGNVLIVNGEVAVGAEVMVTIEDAEVPAPNGEYILDDNRTIIVADGLVSEIKDAEPVKPEELVVPEAAAPETQVPENMPQETMNELLDLFTQFITSVNEKLNQVEKSVTTLNSEFQSFRKEPAVKPIKQIKVETPVNKQEDFINAVIQMRNKK